MPAEELAVVNMPWGEPGRGLFSISVAAELTGLHPQTLRLYDQEGLVRPGRSAGGTRRYSTDDIGRLHQIMTLTSDGINLAGVRRILELQQETRLLQAEVDRLTTVARNRPGRSASPATPARPERQDTPHLAASGRPGKEREQCRTTASSRVRTP